MPLICDRVSFSLTLPGLTMFLLLWKCVILGRLKIHIVRVSLCILVDNTSTSFS